MTFYRLIVLNVARRPIRALLGAAGIAFGVAAMLTVLSIVLGAIGMFEKILSNDSHYLIFEKNVSDLFFSSVPVNCAEEVRALPNVAEAHPLLFGIVSSEDKPVITCFGLEATDPRIREAAWIEGKPGSFTNDATQIFLGSRAATFLEAQAGDEIPIGKDTFIVGGVLRLTNGFEDGGVFMPLPLAQQFFRREGLSSIIAVKLEDPSQGKGFEEAVAARYDDLIALKNEEFRQSYSQFKILTATAWAVGGCAFLLGGMGVANTMLMSVFTRIREIAILRVTGFSKRQVAGMILGESLLLAVVGAVAGFGLGYGGLTLMQNVPQLNGYIQPRFDALIIGGVVLVAFATSLTGAFYPAWRASRIQPAEALRYE
jgi:putative ABC transport system permease protein